MATTENPWTDLADQLLAAGESENLQAGNGIIYRSAGFLVQCPSYIDGDVYQIKEQAAER
jgi:hypothetical protein